MSEVFAQSISPSESAAQEINRQQERERVLRQQQELAPDVRLQGRETGESLGKLPTGEIPCFPIQHIELNGDTSERFQWALLLANRASDDTPDIAIGRCLGTGGISLVMKRIQNAIIQRGFVTTRVLAQPQDLGSGTLVLTLVPGRVHSVRFTEDSSQRATQWNAVPVRRGDLLNLRDIEQGLENFKRIPTAEADIQITPAEGGDAKPGDSDLVIAWKQSFPVRVSLSADNTGTKSSGKYRGNATISGDHFLALNDLLYVSFNHGLGGGNTGARGTRGYTAHYSLPWGYWLLGFSSSYYNFHQEVAGYSQNYLYSGDSLSNELKLSRVVYRDAKRKTSMFVSGWQHSYNNFIDDTEIEVQRRRMIGWDAGVEHHAYIGDAVLDVNADYRHGTGAFSALPAPEELTGDGTSRPSIFGASAQLNLPFAFGGHRWRFTGSFRGQWTRTALVPQDRFSIGGLYTVRGFDGENTLLADSGWLLRNDLGLALGGSGQELYLGLDYGSVNGPSSRYLIGTDLCGAVLGLRGSAKGVSYDLSWGVPLSKPTGFQTASSTVGFSMSVSF
ncbi:MAG TPA: ShlB/FhaC/HecB family hemolysin secretion/activation protein [Noviherbaspirillum sp.]|nr:ShlB/FhaC/HecB family hemolysin secretion/activation protein [Noviherbaspirillum sp.]